MVAKTNALCVFDEPGIYFPKVYPKSNVAIWVRSHHHDVLMGVQVDTPQNASTFANVMVLDENDNEIDYIERRERGR